MSAAAPGSAGSAHGPLEERGPERPPRAAVLTVSDRCSRGETPDESGRWLLEALRSAGFETAEPCVVPDEADAIAAALLELAGDPETALVLTTGGTGLSPRDVTPEATRPLLDREAPGLAETLRAAAVRATPHGMLSRGVSGTRGRTLIVNLPGSLRAVREGFELLAPVLPHALALLRGEGGAPHELRAAVAGPGAASEPRAAASEPGAASEPAAATSGPAAAPRGRTSGARAR
jgi:molybdenum cofactor biosynthesis protein B